MNMIRYERPFGLVRGRRLMDSFLDNFMNDFFEKGVERYSTSTWPRVDIEETDNEFLLRGELPGIDKENIKIELNNNVLSICGKKEETKEEREKNYHIRETFNGSFSRSFTLPESVDGEHIKAEFNDGLLMLTIPKSVEKKPKQIEIK